MSHLKNLKDIHRAHFYDCCITCRLPLLLCLCDETPSLQLATQVILMIARDEHNKLTNTGVLAHRLLKNSKLFIRGNVQRKIITQNEFESPPDAVQYVLYPDDNAIELNDEFVAAHQKNGQKITLICPDGHWGQARKMIHHESSIKNLPRVKLPPTPPSDYRLRHNFIENRVCTIEAIARALGILEGVAVQEKIEEVFNKMVTRILFMRGRLPAAEVV